MRRITKAALTLAAATGNGGGVGGGGRWPGVGELPAAEHSPAVHGSGQRRHAGRQRVRAALRADHRAEQLLRDHRGQQDRRRWPHSHLRADRGQPPARPDHARLVRVQHRHHRKPHQGRDVQLHHQGDRRGPDRHAGLPDHRHRARPARPAGVHPAANGGFLENGVCVLPDAVTRPALPGAPGHQPPGRRHAQRRLRRPARRPVPARHLRRLRRRRRRYPRRSRREPNYTSPCRAPATRASPCTRPTRSAWTRTSRWPSTPAAEQPWARGSSARPIAQNFFLSGGAAPYTWSAGLRAAPARPGLRPRDPRDANDELAGTPTTAGTYTFTMRLTDYDGQQATQQFTLTVDPPLQITTTTLAGRNRWRAVQPRPHLTPKAAHLRTPGPSSTTSMSSRPASPSIRLLRTSTTS